MTAARPQIRTEQHGQAPALTTAVLSLCSRSPGPPTAGNSARTRCTISPASIAGPAPGAAEKGAGHGSRSSGMARMVAAGTGRTGLSPAPLTCIAT